MMDYEQLFAMNLHQKLRERESKEKYFVRLNQTTY